MNRINKLVVIQYCFYIFDKNESKFYEISQYLLKDI